MKTIEERLLDLERRFYPIETVLYCSEFKDLIEEQKTKDIDENGIEYLCEFVIETERGIFTKQFKVKGYTPNQALFFCNRDIIYPNLSKLKNEGKIKWFKTVSKKVIL